MGNSSRAQGISERDYPAASLSLTQLATSTRVTPWAYSGPTLNMQNGLTLGGSQNGSYTLTKTGGSADTWSTGAYSTERHTTCHLAFRAGQTNTYKMMGFSTFTSVPPFGNASDGGASYTTMGFAMYPAADGLVYCYENGAGQGLLRAAAYTTSTVFQMTYDGSNVRYYIDYLLVRTTACSGQALAFDCSFYTSGASVNSVDFGPGTTFIDASIIARGGGGATMVVTGQNGSIAATKSGGVGDWDSDFYGTQAFPTCHLSFKASQTTTHIFVGLSSTPTANQSYETITYSFYVQSGGNYDMRESGTPFGSGTYTTSTVFSMTYDGSNVRFYTDGVLQGTRSASGSLSLDSSAHSPGVAINSLRIGPTITSGELPNPLATISTQFRVLFASEAHAVQFFNSNGEIRISLNHPNTSTTQDQDWNTGLSSVSAAFRQRTTVKLSGATGSAVASRGYYQMTLSPQTIYDGSDIGTGTYTANTYGVEAWMQTIPAVNGGNGADLRIRVYCTDDHSNSFFDTVSAGTIATIHALCHSTVSLPTVTVIEEF